jgi:signal transduction histidine kinase/CheY-like chemotaxis protein/ABC-type branched-subunit amino acid transport system substrate-binding protein
MFSTVLPLLLSLLALTPVSCQYYDRQYYNWSHSKPNILEMAVLYPYAFALDFAGMNLAISEANNNPNLCPNYTLSLVYSDSGNAPNQFSGYVAPLLDFLNVGNTRGSRVSLILGPNSLSFIDPTEQIALGNQIYTPLLTAFASEAELSDWKRYPNFVRIAHNDLQQADALCFLIYSLGWRKIALLTRDSYVNGLAQRMRLTCAQLAISFLTIQTFTAQSADTDVRPQIDFIKQSGARVIVLACANSEISTIAQQFIAAGMHSPPYTFVGTWTFLRALPQLTFHDPVLLSFLTNMIGTYGVGNEPEPLEIFQNKLSAAYNYSQLFTHQENFAGSGITLTYDLTQVAIRALDRFVRIKQGLKYNQTDQDIEIYTNTNTMKYDNWNYVSPEPNFLTPSASLQHQQSQSPPYFYSPTAADDAILYSYLLNTTHSGVSGDISFDPYGDRLATFKIVNVAADGNLKVVGYISTGVPKNIPIVDNPSILPSSALLAVRALKGNISISIESIHWPGNRQTVPLDSMQIIQTIDTIQVREFVAVQVVVLMLWLFVFWLVYFLLRYSSHSAVKYQSNLVNWCTLLGCSLVVATCSLYGLSAFQHDDEDFFLRITYARIFLPIFAFDLIFGSLVATAFCHWRNVKLGKKLATKAGEIYQTNRKNVSNNNSNKSTLDNPNSAGNSYFYQLPIILLIILSDVLICVLLCTLASLSVRYQVVTSSSMDASTGDEITILATRQVAQASSVVAWLLPIVITKSILMFAGLTLAVQISAHIDFIWTKFLFGVIAAIVIVTVNFVNSTQLQLLYYVKVLTYWILALIVLILTFINQIADVYFNTSSKQWVKGRNLLQSKDVHSMDMLQDDLLFVLNNSTAPDDKKYCFVASNNTFAELLGLQGAKQLVGESMLQFVHKQDVQEVVTQLNKLSLHNKDFISPVAQGNHSSENSTVGLKRRHVGRRIERSGPASNSISQMIDHNNNTTVEFTCRFLCGGSGTVHLHIKLSLGRGRDLLYGIAQDVSAQKRLEEEMKKNEDAAIASSKAKALFVANLSHELRTPLNGVVGMTRFLSETMLDHTQRDYVHTIQSCSSHLLQIVTDVLDFSKIESGNMQLEKLPVVVHETVEEAIELAYIRDKYQALEVCYTIAPNVPPVILSDPMRLKQCLVNFLSNSLKFTEKGQIEVIVTVDNDSEEHKGGETEQSYPRFTHTINIENDYFATTSVTFHDDTGTARVQLHNNSANFNDTNTIDNPHTSFDDTNNGLCNYSNQSIILKIAVRDSGIGIKEEKLGILFKPFSQADNSTTRLFGGTGLGLALVRAFAEAFGGKSTVQSKLGEGSTFAITIKTQAVLQESVQNNSTLSPSCNSHPLNNSTPLLTGAAWRAALKSANLAVYQPSDFSSLLGKSLLIVQSNVVAAFALGEMARKLGLHVLIHTQPAVLMQLIEQYLTRETDEANQNINALIQCDMILIDVLIESITAVSLAQALRKANTEWINYNNSQQLPVAIGLMHSTENQLEETMIPQHLFQHFLAKPVKLSHLAHAALDLLNKRNTIKEHDNVLNDTSLVLPIPPFVIPRGISTDSFSSASTNNSRYTLNNNMLNAQALRQQSANSPAIILQTPSKSRNSPRLSSAQSTLTNYSSIPPASATMHSSPPNATYLPARRLLTSSVNDQNNNRLAERYPLRILVAEDNLINQKVIVGLLHRLGYTTEHVTVVDNGKKAVDAVKSIVENFFQFDQHEKLAGRQSEISGEIQLSNNASLSGRASSANSQFTQEEIKQISSGKQDSLYDNEQEKHQSPLPLNAQPFDIVLMDVSMPILDGLQATQQIRAYLQTEAQGFAQVHNRQLLSFTHYHPIIMAMTANALESDRQQCLASGMMDDFIAKPLQFQFVASRLTHWAKSIQRINSSAASNISNSPLTIKRAISDTLATG